MGFGDVGRVPRRKQYNQNIVYEKNLKKPQTCNMYFWFKSQYKVFTTAYKTDINILQQLIIII